LPRKTKGTGKEQSITIQNSGNLSKEDVEKAQKDAEAHAEEDKKKREAVESKNMLDSAIYQAEKMPDEFKDKISDEDKKVIAKRQSSRLKNTKIQLTRKKSKLQQKH
jgi:molecular chaperone DnaK